MLRIALHAVLLAVYTLALGLPAIVVMLVIPNGDPLLWFARPWAWLIARTFGVRVISRGMERIPRDGACVIMCNHQSHFDIVALVLCLPVQYRILAKESLFRIPVFGWALWLAGFIPVNRTHREKAIRSVNRAVEVVRRGRSVVVFAEGTRSPDGRLQPLKKGGFHLAAGAGAPIIPVSIAGGRRVLPKGELRTRRGTMVVSAGAPVPTRGKDASDPAQMEELRRRVREGLEAGLAG